jgi:transposase-like protein
MKYFIIFLIIGMVGCSNPYANPQTSKAVSEKEQVEELRKQNILLEQQNQYLKRIAVALEVKNK